MKVQINAQDVNGFTALMWAAYYNNPIIAKALLENNADTRLRNKYGKDAFALAKDCIEKQCERCIEIVKLFPTEDSYFWLENLIHT